MSERLPAEIDPNLLVMDVDWRNTAQYAQFRQEGNVVRIEPRPYPRRQFWVMNSVFLATSALVALFVLPPWQLATPVAYSFLALVTLLACGLSTGICTWEQRQEVQRGPWLIYDLQKRNVTLPRHGVTIDHEEVVQLEEVSTRSGRHPTNHLISELNLVAMQHGDRRRWNLLRSDASDGAFSHLLIPLRRQVDLPVVRIRGNLANWHVTQMQF